MANEIERVWPVPGSADGPLNLYVYAVAVDETATVCSVCGAAIPEGMPHIRTGTGIAVCPKHTRAALMVLANEYEKRFPPPSIPASRDEIEALQDEGTPWLTECPECGKSQFTTTYRTYADGTDKLTLDDGGKVTDVTARFPRMPDQDPGDLASIQCEGCMTTIWSNPYL